MTSAGRRWWLMLGWLLLAAGFIAHVARSERRALESTLRIESAVVQRVVSQRVDQHDAHLTSLAALALSDASALETLFADVANAIRQYYPRVVAIDLVPVLSRDGPALTTQERTGTVSTDRALRSIVLGIDRGIVIYTPAAYSGRYLLAKPVPNDPSVKPRFVLVLEIDARRLLESDADFWRLERTGVALIDPEGGVIVESDAPASTESGWLRPLSVEVTLGSRTQPLRLITRLHPQLADLLPAGRIVAGLLVMTLLPLIAWLIGALLLRTRMAELRARVGEQDAKLSRAGRINALGEMASGMAHELTQPLTAILSQSQAGLRLLARDRLHKGSLQDVLEANVMQSRRAGEILARLRTWTERSSDRRERVDVNDCVRNVTLLLDAEASRTRTALVLELSAASPEIIGDPVALEQLLFNLVRNGMDAMAKQSSDRTIRITSALSATTVEILVSDSGPGIDLSMKDRLFEPFASGKPDGMGLGLTLCERIVERMDGEIEIDSEASGAVACLRFPQATDAIAGQAR